MQDVMSTLAQMRRPPILLRAARHGALSYQRSRHLQRLLGFGRVPGCAEAIVQLIELEREHDLLRTEGAGGYSLPRHLDVLIALVAEAGLYAARQGPDGI